MERDVVLAGFGGQGIKLCSQVLAQAGALEQKNVLQYAVYGAAVRGGTVRCTAVISDEEIGSPIRSNPWAVMAMDRRSLTIDERSVQPGGWLIVNSSMAPRLPERDDVYVLAIPATDLAKELGSVMAAGMVALGALVAATGIVSLEALNQAVEGVLPPHRRKLLPLNRAAIARGAAYARRPAPSGSPAAGG